MLLRRADICPARVRDRRKASESNVRTSLSLWHGHDCEDVVTVKMAQIRKLNLKLPFLKKKNGIIRTTIKINTLTFNPRALFDIF